MSAIGSGVAGLRRMAGRDPQQRDRATSSLELFFDLVFVIAVGVAADGLLAYDERGHPLMGVVAYLIVFFAIWWAWMGFTWFASAFDTDDWLYRVMTIVQMGGALVFAAGIETAMADLDLRVTVIGYVVMRLAQVGQYLRAARAPAHRATELRYAAGISTVQLLWVLDLLVPERWRIPTFLVLVALELTVPLVAERRAATPFHRRHIAERYGAFTLIVLGEGSLSVADAMIEAFHDFERLLPLVVLGASALVLIAGMWWIYFAREQHGRLSSFRSVFVFGYAHYVVFASAGAVAAGVETAVHVQRTGDTALPTPAVQALTTVPVAVFVVAVWALALRFDVAPRTSAAALVLAVLIALAALVPQGVAVAAVLVIVLVVLLEADWRRHPESAG